MSPHLSMLNNNRSACIRKAASYHHRVNFLKINQLGFLYSKGLIKKNFIINNFVNKIINMNKLYINQNIFTPSLQSYA